MLNHFRSFVTIRVIFRLASWAQQHQATRKKLQKNYTDVAPKFIHGMASQKLAEVCIGQSGEKRYVEGLVITFYCRIIKEVAREDD